MSSTGIINRISDYSLSPHRLHWNLMMGCASSQTGGLPGPTAPASADNEPSAKYPPAEAFEISLDDVDNDNDDRSDSLIKKHPPKRLQKLVEQAATAVPPTTIEHLEEKLAKAEVRRQQYIQQRIDNIITVTGKGPTTTTPNDEDDNQNDGQNEEHNDGGNGKAVIVTSTQDATDVVQPATGYETALSANEDIQTDDPPDADADADADNRTHS